MLFRSIDAFILTLFVRKFNKSCLLLSPNINSSHAPKRELENEINLENPFDVEERVKRTAGEYAGKAARKTERQRYLC